METQLVGLPAHTAQTLLLVSVVFTFLACIPYLDRRSKLGKIPLFTSDPDSEKERQYFLASAKRLYIDGCRKFKDAIYRLAIRGTDDAIIVPTSMLSELRKIPDDFLSFDEASSQLLGAKYTGVDTDSSVLAHSIRADLTPALGRLNAEVLEEIDIAMDRFLPSCEDPIGVKISDILAYIIAQVSGRLFVGTELCRNSDYLECAVEFSLEVMTAGVAVNKVRPWLRPLLAPRLPEVKLLRDRQSAARKLLAPVIRQRKEAEKDPSWEKPNDMMQWILARSDECLEKLTNRQLSLTFAAIHTTSSTATNVLYTLAARPEYISDLQEELRDVLAQNDGILSVTALQQLLKLDSFIREVSLRYPMAFTTFNRRVMKPFTLSNGQHIPAGITLATTSFTMDGDKNTDNETEAFDGFRHYRERVNASTAGEQARAQFVAANEDNLSFGYGRHACPGRFFATNEIKMILARLILDYDIRLPDGVTERHAQINIGNISSPDPTKEIVLHKRQAPVS